MATKEEISMVGFEIVAYAGDAQTDLLAALDAAREGDFEKAEQLHKDASDALIGATTRRPSCFRRRPAVARWR